MDFNKEINEAIQAADYALECLGSAEKHLNSARNWGIFDMLGGGIIATLIKRKKMNNAEEDVTEARRALQRFSKELADVDREIDLNFDTSDFLSFADYFFDGFIADWMVQNRIHDAKIQVRDAIDKVKRIRMNLINMIR